MELKLTKMKMDCYSSQLMLQLVNTGWYLDHRVFYE